MLPVHFLFNISCSKCFMDLFRIAVEEENKMVVDEDQLKEQETGILELGNR